MISTHWLPLLYRVLTCPYSCPSLNGFRSSLLRAYSRQYFFRFQLHLSLDHACRIPTASLTPAFKGVLILNPPSLDKYTALLHWDTAYSQDSKSSTSNVYSRQLRMERLEVHGEIQVGVAWKGLRGVSGRAGEGKGLHYVSASDKRLSYISVRRRGRGKRIYRVLYDRLKGLTFRTAPWWPS